jgi:hypothetical protein
MNTIKKPGQVGHIIDNLIAVAAIDFASCSRILTGEIRGNKRIVVIGGKVGEETVIVARQDSGLDMHVPLLSAIYVDFVAAADVYLTRSEQVYQYANDAEKRLEKKRSKDLREAGFRLFNQSLKLRERASQAA